VNPDTTPPPPEIDPAPRVAPDPPSARTERSRWPGWIWGIPVAAVAIVAWLAFKQISATGPKVTVIFPGAQGISANQTEVQYQGLKVGEVESVRLEKDLRHVTAEIRMNAEMDGHIGPGTLFWINGPSLGDLASIRSIISGPTIGIEPRPGGKQDHYEGLAKPPVISEPVPGHHYVLRAGDPGSVSRGSQIYFRNRDVGTVESVTLASDRSFTIAAFVRSPYDELVHEGTRFWNAGAVQVSLDAAGPRVELQSLPALLGGAVGFETPSGVAEGPVAADGTVLGELSPGENLPVIAVHELPVGQRLAGTLQRQELAVLMAAPGALRAQITGVGDSPALGIVVRLRRGPKLYFGTPRQLQDKWIAAAAVLGNRASAGAAYIDLTDPQRPAAG